MNRYLQKLDTLGLILLVGAAIYYSVTSLWDKWAIGLAVAGAALIVVGIAANYRQIVTTLGRRSTKYATNYIVSVILVIAIVAAVNYVGQRHPKRFDLTASGRYTLAPQTIQVLDQVDQDLQIQAFFPGGDYPALRDLLLQYRTRNPHIRFEFIDPDRQPDVAKQNDVTVYGTFQNPFTGSQLKFGTVVLSYNGRKEKIEKRSEEVTEEDLTNTIIKVERTQAKNVYFIEGHGEKDPSDTERTGYSQAKKALEDQGYKVQALNLASQAKVPDDAKVLIEAGPTTEPFSQEYQFINDFLNRGNGLLVMVDPPPSASLEPLLKPLGAQAENDIVLDVSGAGRLMGAGPSIPLVLRYENHRITDRFRAMTFFPLVRSVVPVQPLPAGVTAEALFRSNDNSWGETDLKSKEAAFDPATDLKGPLSLALAITKDLKASGDVPSPKARVVVVGDSDFPINAYFETQGNGNLFLNMVSWLAQDEDLISIRPKSPEDRRIVLSESQISMLRLLIVILLPGAVLAAGIAVYVRRRR